MGLCKRWKWDEGISGAKLSICKVMKQLVASVFADNAAPLTGSENNFQNTVEEFTRSCRRKLEKNAARGKVIWEEASWKGWFYKCSIDQV